MHAHAGAAAGNAQARDGQRGAVAVAGQRVFQQGQLAQFFGGKRQPRLELRSQAGFRRQRERRVQQGTRGRQPQLAAAFVEQRPQHVQRRIEVGAPDIAAIDDADRQHLVRRQPVGDAAQLMRRADAVHMQAGHGQAAGQAQVFFQRRKVGCQQDVYAHLVQLPVAAFKCAAPGARQVQAQDGLIDLHPVHALLFQAVEQGAVDRQQLVEQGQAVEAGGFFLAQPQEGERADQCRLDLVTQRLRFGHFVDQALAGQRELCLR